MYVAARGGESAIQNAEQLYRDLIGEFDNRTVHTILCTMPYLVDRVMGEGSLYSPELAALALAQSGGDLYEAVLMLRAFRSTQPRIAYAQPVDAETMHVVRRISAAFKDIPGGQVLGPTLDYSHRILDLSVLDETAVNTQAQRSAVEFAASNRKADTENPKFPLVADWQRAEGLLGQTPDAAPVLDCNIPDVTREPITFPAPRAMRLQSLSRADTGGVLALGYANMRGYGSVHPTINELRLGYADVMLTNPITNEVFSAGRVRISQAEVVTTFKGSADKPQLALGFCATIGWNEVKTIAGSMLDMAMDLPEPHPSHTEEYVLYHTDPVESSGFCIHYKLPHYVTFGSSLDAMRGVGEAKKMKPGEGYYAEGNQLVVGMPGTFSEAVDPDNADLMAIPLSAHP
jgi:alpha-D-ribose 1-methylphosphonate 5-triphosphate synthase subunit PhnI